ncbi:hypothetical protein NQ314_014492 [Rhamnusium bicolor]|uniref:Coenzyme Q-binding protein COQ10 START domain-containing protein n=1 Tax=Rhamnusium bicolor TaxID=1586634 RepID=A0AAV8X2A2_9CUCU|nr:hypothetical protein NQ314_014492 [Rhamnusium bicolor]
MQTAKHSVRYLHLFKIPEKKKEYLARKLVGFSKDEMYLVVADVRHYKLFLPFCTKSTILRCHPKELKASLEIGFPPVVESYTSTVTLDRPNLVRAVCRDGRLFNYLETTWRFSPGLRSNPKSCIIDFKIKFEFKSVLHSQLASMFFDRLVHQMENAFINEAKRRYGKESLPSHQLSPVKS